MTRRQRRARHAALVPRTSMSSDVTANTDTRANGGITTATTEAHHVPDLNAVCPSPDVAGASHEKPKEISDLPPDVLVTIMGYLPEVSDRFRLASVSKDFRSALHDPRTWETLIIDKDLAKRLLKEDSKAFDGQNRLRQLVEYAGNGVKTLELHGAIDWSDDFLKTLLVDRNLTSSVFFQNLVSLTLEDIEISAPELVEFVESFVLPRPKAKRLEKFLIINTPTNFDGTEEGITRKQLERLTESLRYDANDVSPERFNITPCVACEGICQFDLAADYECDPFVCSACGDTLCEDHRDGGTMLCAPDYESGDYCDICELSPLCRRQGCPSYPSKYIDDRTISCECGTRYALGHAPDTWLKGLEKCAEQGCGKNLCSRDHCRIGYEADRGPSSSCSICKKIWCSDHIPPGMQSCGQCFSAEKFPFEYFYACPSCVQAHKATGEHFKLCTCKAKLACKSCADFIFDDSCSQGYEINEIYCRKCMTKDHILLGFLSDDCYSGCSDEEYIEEIENGRKQAEQRMEREMDQYCL